MEKNNEPWQVVSSKYLFRRPWLTVRCDDMLLPNGNHIPEYYILEYPDWVNTIAITKEGKFIFVRQFRPGIGRTMYELCAGVCEKEDPSPMVSAQHLEATEDLTVHLLTLDEVKQLLQNNEILQALHAAPLWKYIALYTK